MLRAACASLALLAAACSSDDNTGGRGTPATPGLPGAQQPGNLTPGSMPMDNGFGNADSQPAEPASGMLPTGAAGAGGGACAEGDATATPVTPTVWLVVDGSSSMNNSFEPASTRWETLRATLMNPGGIVDSLASVVRFGLVIYSGADAGAACPNLVTVQPALDNYATLDAAYPAQPIGQGTPTHSALDHVVTSLPVLNMQALDAVVDPIYVVLATDGQPNDPCGAGGFGGFNGGAQVEQQVIDVVSRGVMGGMRMFVISLAGGDQRLQAHLDQVAEVGNPGQMPFVPATEDELVATFQSIVGGATCRIALDGMVMDGAQCQGEVLLNGQALACDSDNGWRLPEPDTVQLTGSACETFISSQSMVRASFPCGVFSPD